MRVAGGGRHRRRRGCRDGNTAQPSWGGAWLAGRRAHVCAGGGRPASGPAPKPPHHPRRPGAVQAASTRHRTPQGPACLQHALAQHNLALPGVVVVGALAQRACPRRRGVGHPYLHALHLLRPHAHQHALQRSRQDGTRGGARQAVRRPTRQHSRRAQQAPQQAATPTSPRGAPARSSRAAGPPPTTRAPPASGCSCLRPAAGGCPTLGGTRSGRPRCPPATWPCGAPRRSRRRRAGLPGSRAA